ncbi:MAG: acyl-CoA thioesterase [Bacteroidota bacterium]
MHSTFFYLCRMQSPNIQFRHSTPVQIRFADCDMLGHVNNAVYQQYFDFARLQYFSRVLGQELDWNRYAVMVATITIDYLSPIPLDDEVEIFTRIDTIGNKSMGMIQQVYSKKAHEIRASNRAVLVCYNREKMTTVSLPESWRAKFLGYDKNITLKMPLQGKTEIHKEERMTNQSDQESPLAGGL